MAVNPSGEQFAIAFGDHAAVVTEVGATLRAYSVAGREVLEGFAASEMCSGGRGQLLAPWPNRIRDGSYRFRDRTLQLPHTEPERRNAIHGLVRWSSWRALERSEASVRLGTTVHPQPGYPFTLELAVEYSLGRQGLRSTLSAVNAGGEPAPFGAGAHPYLKPRGELVDGGLLRIPARSYLETDERLIPTGRRLPVDGTPHDFRAARPVGETVLDTCFVDFEEPVVEFDGLSVSWDERHRCVQLFSGDTLGPERRRRGLAVEPMTCPADAFNSGDGLVVLAPGEEWSGGWGIRLG